MKFYKEQERSFCIGSHPREIFLLLFLQWIFFFHAMSASGISKVLLEKNK